MDSYQTLNETLVVLFNQILNIEERALLTEDFPNLSVNDFHIIEAIGNHPAPSMGIVAKTMGVTVGTLTIAINSLVKKGYVTRERSVKDKRVVLLHLTPSGTQAFHHHKAFHEQFIQGVLDRVAPEELDLLVRALSGLNQYFESL